jgi:CBS domain-containing protein
MSIPASAAAIGSIPRALKGRRGEGSVGAFGSRQKPRALRRVVAPKQQQEAEMANWRDAYRDEGERIGRGRRELAPAPQYARQDRDIERGFGEGEFERGGRPFGGYAQGGYETHMRGREAYRGGGRGYGAYGGGAYREQTGERRGMSAAPRTWDRSRRVSDVMTLHAEVLSPTMNLRDAARRMRNDDLGAYPVGEFDRLVGMITDRDIAVRAVADDRRPSETAIRDVMSRHVIYCFEDDDVEDIAELMAEHQVRRIPVLNQQKRLVGMVALADLGLCSNQQAAGRALEGVSERTGAARR